MQALNATGLHLGIVGAVRQFATFAQLPSAYVVERMPRRKPYWATVAIIHRALWLVPALWPFLAPQGLTQWPLFLTIAIGISDMLGQASTAPWLSWMSDLLPPSRAGRFWGVRQRVVAIFLVLSCLLYGWLLDKLNTPQHPLLGFSWAFALVALFGVSDILIHIAVREPAPTPAKSGISFWKRLQMPFHHRDFRRLTFAMGAWNAAMALTGYTNGTPGFLNFIYLQEHFNATYSQAAWLILASAVGAMLWTPRIGHAIDRFGARTVAVWLMALGPTSALAWFFVSPSQVHLPFVGSAPQAVALMSALSLLIGGFYSGVYLCQLRLTQAITPPAGRTLTVAAHWAAVGGIAAVGAFLGGWIKDHSPLFWNRLTLPMGAQCSYFQLLVLMQALLAWFVAIPMLLAVQKDSPHTPASAA